MSATRLFWDTPAGASARLSDDGTYRYELARRWGGGPQVTFVMLNPSTADATVDDPTIRRCRGFAKAWGMGGLFVVNLFAFRATKPTALLSASDPIGPENDDAIHDVVVRSRAVCVAWGAHSMASTRAADVLELLDAVGRDPICLGTTKDGHPRHPLYVRADARPVTFRGAAGTNPARSADTPSNPEFPQ